jgi:hypothetical protein
MFNWEIWNCPYCKFKCTSQPQNIERDVKLTAYVIISHLQKHIEGKIECTKNC